MGDIIGSMVKKFLIFLLVFGFLLKFSPEVLANIPRVVTTPIIIPTTTPAPTPTPALLIKPRVVTTIVLPPTATVSPTATPTSQPTQEVLTSPTPQPTPTPQISPLPTSSASSTNIWQLTTVGLAAALVGGLIAALALKKGGKKEG